PGQVHAVGDGEPPSQPGSPSSRGDRTGTLPVGYAGSSRHSSATPRHVGERSGASCYHRRHPGGARENLLLPPHAVSLPSRRFRAALSIGLGGRPTPSPRPREDPRPLSRV